MPTVPTAYSSLPALTVERDARLKVVSSPAVPAAALPVIRIPGTALAPGAGGSRETQGARVNPVDVLAASTRARLAWQALSPTAMTRPSFVVNRDAVARLGVGETGAVGGRPQAEPRAYNREAAMQRLEKEGARAAKPICSGC